VSARHVTLRVNGTTHEIEADPDAPLIDILRSALHLKGTRFGCGLEQCGACNVLVDGKAMPSCTLPLASVEGRSVTTIEGLADHPLVDAFVRADALQCGFCTPGQIVSAAALVEAVPEPTADEVRHAMSGNLCRCGAYPKIEEAILAWRG